MTERDSLGKIEWYKARLVAKNFACYHETFSLVSKKDLLKIILTLVTYFDWELYQIDMKTVFLNENLEEMVYII